MGEENPKVRMGNIKPAILIALIVVSVGIFLLLQYRDSSMPLFGKPMLKKGAAAPDISLPDLDGNIISLADYRGKVVLLNIWATWCPPCVEEMPSMEKLHQELKGDNFAIVAVSIDVSGAKAVTRFMEKHKLSFTALTDPEGTIKSLYQTTGVPESFVVDQRGVIVEKIIGPRDWAAPGIIDYFRSLTQGNK